MKRFANTSAMVVITIALAILLTVTGAAAQQPAKFSKERLVGIWMVSSITDVNAAGKKTEAFGDNDGMLVFTAAGRYSYILARKDLPRIASNGRATVTAEESMAIVKESVAQFGTYTFDEATGTLTFKVERSTFANLNGNNQLRTVSVLTATEFRWHNPTASSGTGAYSDNVFKRVE